MNGNESGGEFVSDPAALGNLFDPNIFPELGVSDDDGKLVSGCRYSTFVTL
jgi:hypothetical protein